MLAAVIAAELLLLRIAPERVPRWQLGLVGLWIAAVVVSWVLQPAPGPRPASPLRPMALVAVAAAATMTVLFPLSGQDSYWWLLPVWAVPLAFWLGDRYIARLTSMSAESVLTIGAAGLAAVTVSMLCWQWWSTRDERAFTDTASAIACDPLAGTAVSPGDPQTTLTINHITRLRLSALTAPDDRRRLALYGWVNALTQAETALLAGDIAGYTTWNANATDFRKALRLHGCR